jgi:O-antigen/teichoic acid export membrane protein
MGVRRAVVVVLRVTTLLSRLLLTVALARYLSLAEVGQYGVYAAAVVLGFSLSGLEAYTVTSRALVGNVENQETLIAKHLGLIVVAAGCVGVPVSMVLGLDVGSTALILTIGTHSFAESISQDIGRLLIPMGMPATATVFGFLRGGLWAVGFCASAALHPAFRTLSTVVYWWFGVSILALLGGVAILRLRLGSIRLEVNWPWIRRTTAVAFPFLLGSIALRILIGGDRLAVARVLSLEEVGVYTVYASLAFAAISMVDSSIVAFRFPHYVGGVMQSTVRPFGTSLRRMASECAISALMICVACVGGAPYLFRMLGEDAYARDWPSFAVLMCGVAVYIALLPAHFALYALGRDRAILMSNATGLVVFGILLVPLANTLGVLGATAATGGGVACVGIVKLVFAWRVRTTLDDALLFVDSADVAGLT